MLACGRVFGRKWDQIDRPLRVGSLEWLRINESQIMKALWIVAAILTGLSGIAPHAATAAGECGYYVNRAGHEVPRPCGNWRDRSEQPPSTATARCSDGTWSSSEHPNAPGTCSHHGGVEGYR